MIRINALSFAKLIKALSEDSQSIRDLADHTGLHFVTVRRYVRALHKEKVIYVCGWDPDSLGRLSIPVYGWGNKKDVARQRLSAVERSNRYRRRKKDQTFLRALQCPTPTLSLD